MQLFRKLAGNILFKIILAFIALSFVLFGVSGFILSGPSAWVAKVGNKTISYSEFTKETQKTREMLLQSNKNAEIVQYLDSDQFKSDILGRLVNSIIIEKLQNDIGVEASKKLILSAIAKDRNFKDKDGKFDRKNFQNFLARNGLDEEKYIKLIQSDVVATMIIQTMSLAAPINEKAVIDREEFKQEKRVADVIKISSKNLDKISLASEEELEKFYQSHKKSYLAPEIRKVSYLRFAKSDFAKDLKISEAEITAEYEKNKDNFQKPESRDFYHILFDKEESAQEFITKLDVTISNKSKPEDAFLKLAKNLQNKNQKNVTLKNVTKKDLIPDLANSVFQMKIGDHSQVLKSPLGFHVFLLNQINPSQPISFAQAKEKIKSDLLQGREEKIMQAKISEIDDNLLASNSISETAKKFNLAANVSVIEINQAGQNKEGDESFEIKSLENFVEHSFAAQKDQASKVFYSKINNQYYALKVEEIVPAHEKTLDEIKSQVSADLNKSKQAEALKKLASEIAKELQANPENVAAITSKYKLANDRNKLFSRFSFVNYQGRQIPFIDKFSASLFNVKINQATEEVQTGEQEFSIGVLRAIKKTDVEKNQIDQAKNEAANIFRNEILQGYNAFVMKKYPVKINDKILGKKE